MFVSRTSLAVNKLRFASKMETGIIIARMQHFGPRGSEPGDNSAERLQEGSRLAEKTKIEESQTLTEKVGEMVHNAREKLGELAQSAKKKI